MKDFITKRLHFTTVEFWAATTIFVFMVFFSFPYALSFNENMPSGRVDRLDAPFNYYLVSSLIRYTVQYAAFLFLSFYVVPNFIDRKSVVLNVFYTILVVLLLGAVFGVVNTVLKTSFTGRGLSRATLNYTFQNSFLYACWLLMLFGFYSVLKYFSLYLLSRSEAIQANYKFVTHGGLVAFIVWMFIMFLIVVSGPYIELIAVWAIIMPFAILYYLYAFHKLIPKSLAKKHPVRSYIFRTFLIVMVSLLPIFLFVLLLTDDDEAASGITAFNFAFQLLFTAPLSWVLFKRRMQGAEEIYVLKTELGRSHANFDFLRSQINPHFLFNALNTIYGTAIQEGAERTSEGIEKLGDMMRFMLQENMQEKISLAREIDYLNNYISLQKLRTDPNPIIRIEADIEQQTPIIQIAPMLLIPFVENAFKHGISFREPSYIKINLEVRNNTLYLDVNNSKHVRPESDPEKDKSGIGLNNVRQRLQLLYPTKHELIIRETKKDFFVHLTLQLS